MKLGVVGQGVLLLAVLAGCSEPELNSGKALYDYHCAGCHKEDGAGLFIKGAPPVAQTELSVTQLRDMLRGHDRPRGDKSAMPTFTQLTSAEIQQILTYLRHTLQARK